MEKIEYLLNQFRKTSGKPYENYCILRIYSLLNRDDIKIVTQQLFKRKNNKIALADLYLPQINMWIEIDEQHHEKNIKEDKKRTHEVIDENRISPEAKKKYDALEEVINIKLEKPYRVVVYNKSLKEINDQIDKIVNEINKRIKKLDNRFIPWVKVTCTADDFIKKGIISVEDNAKFKTIDEIGKLFGFKEVPFNQKLHAYVNIDKNLYFWCPTVKINGDECTENAFENEISDDGQYIYEHVKKDMKDYLNEVLSKNIIRYIFLKYKDETGKMIYKFKGVYTLDEEITVKTCIRTWKLINNTIDLKKFK